MITKTKKIPNLTFVLVPELPGCDSLERLNMYKRALRYIHSELRLTPIAPEVYYSTFLSDGELTLAAKREMFVWWLKRSTKLYIVLGSYTVQDLDPITFDIIASNELIGFRKRSAVDPMRIPTVILTWCDTYYNITEEKLTRKNAYGILMANIANRIFL
jgi:hypothetical protein